MGYADIRNKRKTSSIIPQGGTKLNTEDVLNQKLTVIDIDLITTREGRCAVLLFEEYPNQFYFGGKVLQVMCEDFLSDAEALEELRAGKVQIILSKAKSSTTGREYVTFDYVDSNEEA